jgi:hypothetical protein
MISIHSAYAHSIATSRSSGAESFRTAMEDTVSHFSFRPSVNDADASGDPSQPDHVSVRGGKCYHE